MEVTVTVSVGADLEIDSAALSFTVDGEYQHGLGLVGGAAEEDAVWTWEGSEGGLTNIVWDGGVEGGLRLKLLDASDDNSGAPQ
jgi:hypothetical protein